MTKRLADNQTEIFLKICDEYWSDCTVEVTKVIDDKCVFYTYTDEGSLYPKNDVLGMCVNLEFEYFVYRDYKENWGGPIISKDMLVEDYFKHLETHSHEDSFFDNLFNDLQFDDVAVAVLDSEGLLI